MQQYDITNTKTYATKQAAKIAAEKKFGNTDLRYFIYRNDEDRYFPVFIGEAAVQAGVHFHFNVIG